MQLSNMLLVLAAVVAFVFVLAPPLWHRHKLG